MKKYRHPGDLSLPTGQSFGRYILIKKLGGGGMGVVYAAYDPKLNLEVAIKLIRTEKQTNEDMVRRFLREQNLTSQLKHPNIIKVYEVGTEGENYYIVMDLIDGDDISQLISKKVLTPKWSLQIIAKIARALDYAHQNGIVHRDIKPGNILIAQDRERTPYLMDFGLARSFQESAFTRTGQILGTPKYMSPEQADGMTKSLDARSDVYSLGMVLYEMLSGKPIVDGSTLMEIIIKAINPQITPLSQLVPDIPKEVDSICAKALQKPPDKRYQTAAAFAEAIEKFLIEEGRRIYSSSLTVPLNMDSGTTDKVATKILWGEMPQSQNTPLPHNKIQLQGEDIVPGYDMLEKIGEGGMGVVYLARDISSNDIVAIKILNLARRVSSSDREAFAKEGKLMVQLSHPNLIKAYGYETRGDVDYLVMEYVEGIPLNKFVKNAGYLSEERAISLMTQVVCGLTYLWKHGVVHCDIKPGNLILSKENVVKIGDLGLARKANAPKESLEKNLFGTPHYMSPEHIKGEYVDYRSDVYSLGATIYYLVSGRHPYEGRDSIQVVREVLEYHKPAPISRVAQGKVSSSLIVLVEQWMDMYPARRCQTHESVSIMLKNAAEASEKQEPVITKIKPALSWVPIITAVSVILVGVLIWIVYFSRSSFKKTVETVDWVALIPKETWFIEYCDPEHISDFLWADEEEKTKTKENLIYFLSSISVSLKDIKKIYLYLRHASQTGCIIKGDFKSQKASWAIDKKKTKTYKGFRILNLELTPITDIFFHPIGPCIFSYLNSLKSNLGSLTFLDDETLVLGNNSEIQNIIDCYNKEKPAFADNRKMVALVNKPEVKGILWMVANPPDKVIQDIQKNFSSFFEKLESGMWKKEFLTLQSFILTLNASPRDSLECILNFQSKEAPLNVETIVYRKLNQFEYKNVRVKPNKPFEPNKLVVYFHTMHMADIKMYSAPNENNFYFNLNISSKNNKAIWELLTEYTNRVRKK